MLESHLWDFHAHAIIVDDPIDPKRAVSEAELKSAREFMTDVIPKRKIEPKEAAVTILIMQRLHREDPTAVMLKRSRIEGAIPVRHICLPAELADNVHPPELKEKYVDGLLDPERMSHRFLSTQKADGAYSYSSQYQQSPVPLGGGMFKRIWFNQRVKAAPYNARRVRSWDRASTADGGCYTAGVLMAKDAQGNYFVEDCVHGQWEPDERNKIMRATAMKDRGRYGPKHDPMILIEDEGGSSGKDASKGLGRVLAGFKFKFEKVTGSKDTRAEPWACQLAAQNVFMVEDGKWDLEGYISEHEMFRPDPTTKRLGKFKDMVDSSSMAFNWLVGGLSNPGLRTFHLGSGKNKQLRIVACSLEELSNTIIENRALLTCFSDPIEREVGDEGVDVKASGGGAEPPLPVHGLNKLLAGLTVQFCDIDPADHQESWDDLIAPFDRPASELVMRPEHAKKMWAHLLKKRESPAEVFVFADDGDRRALSVAMAVADSLSLPRSVIWRPGAEEEVKAGPAPNPHVYAVTKAGRNMVVG